MMLTSRLIPLGIAAAISVIAFCGCSGQDATESPQPTATSTPPDPPLVLGSTLYLTSGSYPSEGVFGDRIVREIVRQGLLVVAREDLGMLTRDQTLGETLTEAGAGSEPTGASAARPLQLRVRLTDDGEWVGSLSPDGEPRGRPLWEGKGDLGDDQASRYAILVAQVADAAGAIGDSLRESGGAAASRDGAAPAAPPTEVLDLLGQMNFVSQYTIAKSAHQALRKSGPSAAWYGVLVRAYAHLSALTQHTWSSHSDAFAARALIYAERMSRLTEGDATSRRHRAYAYAVLGMHALAEAESEELDGLASDDAPATPAWAQLTSPVYMYDHEAIDQIRDDHPELRQTADYFQWQLYYSYLHGRWVYEKGIAAMQACPEAYGVYSKLANWNALRVERIGSAAGMAAFVRLLPARILKSPELPTAVREAAPEATTPEATAPRLGLFAARLNPFDDGPMKLSRALVAASRDEPDAELTWEILGSLIAEEQFVQAANMLSVSANAVEHSKSELVEFLTPLVEGHRYAGFIMSYAHEPSERRSINAALSEITIADPRAVTAPMLARAWDLFLTDGMCGTELGVRATEQVEMTLPALLDAHHHVVWRWSNHYKKKDRWAFLDKFPVVGPRTPLGRRRPFYSDDFERSEQVKELEERIGIDPIGWITAAEAYRKVGDEDNAIRCYQESLRISPSMIATESLAQLYYGKGLKDKWEATLKSYLELEDLSLTHAKVHQKLANEHIARRDWKKAEPHALEAAQTYSAWGLELAARTYEGMRDFDKALHFYAEASKSYPSYHTGIKWYLACHRTGTGDLDAARTVAARNIAVAKGRRNYDALLRVALYRWLEGDLAAAIEQVRGPLQQAPDSAAAWTRAYNLLFMACIASEADDSESLQQSISGLRALLSAEDIKQHPDWIVVFNGICDLFADVEPPTDFVEVLKKALAETSDLYRCDYSYFVGAAFEHAGQIDKADEHYARAAFQSPFDRYTSAFAGRQLVTRHGVDRGGLPEDFAQLEAKAQQTE